MGPNSITCIVLLLKIEAIFVRNKLLKGNISTKSAYVYREIAFKPCCFDGFFWLASSKRREVLFPFFCGGKQTWQHEKAFWAWAGSFCTSIPSLYSLWQKIASPAKKWGLAALTPQWNLDLKLCTGVLFELLGLYLHNGQMDWRVGNYIFGHQKRKQFFSMDSISCRSFSSIVFL